MSAAQFMEALFGKLPEFFKDEDELRTIGTPDTRRKLQMGSLKGFGKDQVAGIQKDHEAREIDLLMCWLLCYADTPVTPREQNERVVINPRIR